MSQATERITTGRRLLLGLYLGLVALAGVLGGLIGLILPAKKGVTTAAMGPVTFPMTPLTMAVYGIVNVGLVLGVLLLLVRYVSRRFDDTPDGEDDEVAFD